MSIYDDRTASLCSKKFLSDSEQLLPHFIPQILCLTGKKSKCSDLFQILRGDSWDQVLGGHFHLFQYLSSSWPPKLTK